MKHLDSSQNFLAITEPQFFEFESSKVVIQSVPYEYTSSYISGSHKGPKSILEASHFVELYDEELDLETYKSMGISTLQELDFTNKINENAIDYIEQQTDLILQNKKFVVSLGAEHTVTFGFVKAFKKHFQDFAVLQIDAHSDLRLEYQGNKLSHASVMARIHELQIPLFQIGIRAQCKEESDLIKSSDIINTWYAHQINQSVNWHEEVINKLPEQIYLTIDADGFDPTVMPAVGTAEPGGLYWQDTLSFLKKLADRKTIIGFDIVECAPRENEINTQYNLAKLVYKILGYISNGKNNF